MAKFVNSREAISSSLLLWNDVATQVAIEETYGLDIWPITGNFNDGPINYLLPPQSKGMLTEIHIIPKLKIQKDGEDLTFRHDNLSVVNNFGNSIWEQVDIQLDDRIDISQSMKNAYAFQTFFNHVLNSESNRADYLYYNENFKMDEGKTKKLEEESRTFWRWNDSVDDEIKKLMPENVTNEMKNDKLREFKSKLEASENAGNYYKCAKYISTSMGYENGEKIEELTDIVSRMLIPSKVNPSASDRSRFLRHGESLTLCTKLQHPLFNTSKSLPTNMRIKITLTKNNDEFVILSDGESKYSIFIEDCYLHATYYRPRDSILSLIEERLRKEAASYFISRPEIIVKPLSNAGRIIRISDVFHNILPPYAFFCLLPSKDFEGSYKTNPYTFIPFQNFQFHVNGRPHFANPLHVTSIKKRGDGHYEYMGFGEYMVQLYKTLGKDVRGDCLINSSNFALHFMVGISFGADKSSLAERHLNLQEKASTYLEIDMGINDGIPQDMVLLIYTVHDRQIQIDADRKITIIE